MNSHILVLSTAPHNFAGAAVANARTLVLLAASGATVQFFSPAQPFYADALDTAGVQIVFCGFHSDAYPTSDTVAYASVAEAMLHSAERWLEQNPANRIILFATYLFPFGSAAEGVARALRRFDRRVDCVLVPAGSDIWQIGKQFPLITRQMIESPSVTAVAAYSARFAKEVACWIGTQRETVVIPPAIDTLRLTPLGPEERRTARLGLGISETEFVLSHCSNHRPVKGLSHVIEVAVMLAGGLSEDVHLLMVGPITANLRDVLVAAGLPEPDEQLPYRAQIGNLRITCVGLQKDVRLYHGIADVAVNTSLHDSFNISLAEAMACEVPVLTSDVAGVCLLVDTYKCGVTIPFRHNPVYTDSGPQLTKTSRLEIGGVVKWLIQLRHDDNLRRRLGKRARQAVVECCSDAAVTSAWSKLLGIKG